MSEIRLTNVVKRFGTTEVIRDVSLTAQSGEFVVFVGPSGCGKSTLLRLIAGLEETTSGKIEIEGRDVTSSAPHSRELSMVFQSYALYPHMSVRQNIAFALHAAKLPAKQVQEKVAEAARALQLEPYLDRKPKALSGGQRQRVAIGRAIVRAPKGFLFDEPLSNLDASLRAETRLEIARLHKELGATMLYVTHDQVEAMTLADKIVVLNGGRIMQTGTPRDLYDNPENLFVAQFLGSPKMNVLPCSSDTAGRIEIPGAGGFAPSPAPSGRPVQVGLRPEHLSLVDPGQGDLQGQIELSEYLGADTSVFVDLGQAGRITLRASGMIRPRDGEPVGVVVDPRKAHYFDAEGNALRKTPTGDA